MYCGQCGSPIPDAASFCPACGKPVTAAATPVYAPAEDATEAETGLLYEPESEYETGLLVEPESEDATGLLYEPESEGETTLLYEPEFEYETGLLVEPESEDATGLLREPESEYETSLLYEPASEDETGLLVEPASEDATTLLDDPDSETTVITAVGPDDATTVINAVQPVKPQVAATAAGAAPRRRRKFQRAYELPDSALQPQTEPTYANAPVTAAQSQPIYIMPVMAPQGADGYQTGAIQPVQKKSSHGVLIAVIGAALGVAIALFLAFQMGLVGGVRVPDVTGLSPDNAATRLKDAGFEVKTHDEMVDQGVGIVVSVEPAANTSLSRGSTVDIGIGIPRTVPDIYGINVDDAIAELTRAGALHITVQEVISPNYEPGTVIAVDPAPGNVFNSEDTITIEVAVEKP